VTDDIHLLSALRTNREGRMDSGVPIAVERLVNAIKASGMKEEGLMRVSGVISEVNQLRQQFDKGLFEMISRGPSKIEIV